MRHARPARLSSASDTRETLAKGSSRYGRPRPGSAAEPPGPASAPGPRMTATTPPWRRPRCPVLADVGTGADWTRRPVVPAPQALSGDCAICVHQTTEAVCLHLGRIVLVAGCTDPTEGMTTDPVRAHVSLGGEEPSELTASSTPCRWSSSRRMASQLVEHYSGASPRMPPGHVSDEERPVDRGRHRHRGSPVIEEEDPGGLDFAMAPDAVAAALGHRTQRQIQRFAATPQRASRTDLGGASGGRR